MNPIQDPQGAQDRESLLEDSNTQDADLAPIDGGRAAWVFLAGCCLVEAVMWGFCLSYGIIQAALGRDPLFRDSSNQLAVIGTTLTSMAYFGLPVVHPIARRYAAHQVYILRLGWLICIAALVASSFATRVWHLILTQGLLYGAGWSTCYTPCMIMMNGWFHKRRGTVYGIMFASAGFASLVFPFILEALLQRFGYRNTLRIFSVGAVAISGPSLLLIRPRKKPDRKSNDVREKKDGRTCWKLVSNQLLKNKTFIVFTIAVFFQGIGFFLPRFYLPSFAHDLSLSHAQGAIVLACIGLAQIFGQPGLGFVSDKVHVHVPTTLSTTVCAAATLFLWAPAKRMEPLVIFALLYGSFGGGYSVLWARWTMYLTEDEGTTFIMYSFFSVARGLGDLLAGPVSSTLEGSEIRWSQYGLGKYRSIVGFVGISMLLSALSIVAVVWDSEVKETRRLEKSSLTQERQSDDGNDASRELEPFLPGSPDRRPTAV